MKKIGLLALFLVLPALTGCDFALEAKVSTAQELIDASGKGRKIVLQNDIDFDYQTLSSPLSIHSLEGNNYTIKNVVVHTTNNVTTSLFCSENKDNGKIANVKFEDITITGDSTQGASFISDRSFKEFENVQIKKSSLTITAYKKSSCVVGAISSGTDPREVNYKKEDKVIVKNCKVIDSKIVVNGPSSDGPDFYISGVAGDAQSISKCLVDNLTIEATGGYTYQDVYIGGISSHAQGSIDNCEVKNSHFTGTTTWHGSNILGITNVSTSYIGGIFCTAIRGAGNDTIISNNTISFCTVHNNVFDTKACGAVRNGGITAFNYGSINNCVSYENEIKRLKVDDSGDKHLLGGITGNGVKGSITSCISYGNQLIDENTKGDDKYESAGGLLGGISETVVSRCATGNNTIKEIFADEFSPSSKNISESYVSNNQYLNSNNLPMINKDEFKDSSAMMVKLLLNAPQWDFSGEMPILDLGL